MEIGRQQNDSLANGYATVVSAALCAQILLGSKIVNNHRTVEYAAAINRWLRAIK